jgi:mRNA degradation ribonuclease J1/J2
LNARFFAEEVATLFFERRQLSTSAVVVVVVVAEDKCFASIARVFLSQNVSDAFG